MMVTIPDDGMARKLIDNTFMLYAARFVVPLIGFAATTALAIIGWFVTTTLTDLKKGQETGIVEFRDSQRQVWTQMGKLNDTQTASSVALSSLSSKVDGSIKQLDHLQAQVDKLPTQR